MQGERHMLTVYNVCNHCQLTNQRVTLSFAETKVSNSSLNALSYNIINGIFVLFTLVKVEVIWFDTFISD